jgi:hypothetical protein
LKKLHQRTFQPIENYDIIGNLCKAALIGIDSSIDFFCFPKFDSPTVFAALLDPERGGPEPGTAVRRVAQAADRDGIDAAASAGRPPFPPPRWPGGRALRFGKYTLAKAPLPNT